MGLPKYMWLVISIFILITTKFAASETGNCGLEIRPSLFNDSSCQEGDWDGFLQNNCCGAAFDAYLYALGSRANQTGEIFLNSTEQRSCLYGMKALKDDVFGCGIEKLTSGSGGCSDFSVTDVVNKFGEELKNLGKNCQIQNEKEPSSISCPSCMNTWKAIKGAHSGNTSKEAAKVEADLCSIAVLVSLISSKIDDDIYVHALQRCLGTSSFYGEDQASEDNQKMRSKRGIWIVIGSTIAVVLIIILPITAYILYHRCFKSIPSKNKALEEVILKETSCPRVSLKEVYNATNHLNEMNIIGEGTSGKVYKGTMTNNQHVAIKHIINDDANIQTFVREITSLSHVRHQNLVALLGCCVEGDKCFLVYELCPNGNLSEWLFGKGKVLSWIQRLEIAIDSAKGLWFLHTYPGGCIVHRDIKPTNILLGPKFEAKLSDFGLSKIIEVGETYVSSEVRGTFGYVDPEYQSNHHVNSYGDVYSFGMVLLQILSGKKVINLKLRKPMSLNKMARALTRGGCITEFADPKLQGEYSEEAFDFTLHLALSCTALDRKRPSMEEVVTRLQEALLISTRNRNSSGQSFYSQIV
ncbi:putative receptor-like protein kinase [Senna tora]|uniref:Putative receptor-like protein kinase n=1 Tax=Senna tora TaxID=362788 RepID=A0A834TCI8_9FABA|nr:putative receptor-like protein kinase [Senna tora]